MDYRSRSPIPLRQMDQLQPKPGEGIIGGSYESHSIYRNDRCLDLSRPLGAGSAHRSVAPRHTPIPVEPRKRGRRRGARATRLRPPAVGSAKGLDHSPRRSRSAPLPRRATPPSVTSGDFACRDLDCYRLGELGGCSPLTLRRDRASDRSSVIPSVAAHFERLSRDVSVVSCRYER